MRTTPIHLLFFIIVLSILFLGSANATLQNVINSAYVYSDQPNTNYGSNEYLYVRGVGLSVHSYLELPYSNSSVTLSVYSMSSDSISVYSTTLFDENTITWNTKPIAGNLITSFTSCNNCYSNIIIPAGNRYILFNSTLGTLTSFFSDDFSNVSLRPYIDYTIPPINNTNTNTIKASNTIDYNASITSTTNSSVYLTTWVNNSNWAFWSPLLTKVNVIQPNGANVFVSTIWGQNANRIQYSFYNSGLSPYGTYQFRLLNCVLCDYSDPTDLLASVNVTYNNPADALDTIKFNQIGNNVSFTYWTNPLKHSNNLNHAAYKVTYEDNDYFSTDKTEYTLISYCCGGISTPGWNGTVDIGSLIKGKNYFEGKSTILRVRTLNYTNTVMAQDTIIYKYIPINIVPINVTPIPTPIPTPNATYSPLPTIQPTPDINQSAYNGSGIGNMTGYIVSVGNQSIGIINSGSTQINSQITAYDYTTSKSVYGYFLSSIFNMIPTKLWMLIILGWALELSLLLLRR